MAETVKKNKCYISTRSVRLLTIIILVVGFLTVSAVRSFAVSETSREDYAIVPGVTESAVYVTDSGGKNVRVHILRIDSNADVSLKATCYGYYSEGSTVKSRSDAAAAWNAGSWGYQKLKELADVYESAGDTKGKVVAASSGDYFNKETGSPLGNLVIEGHVLNNSQAEPFFGVLKNGRCVIRDGNGDTTDVEEAVGGAFYLLKDGTNLINSADTTREPRQAIGVCSDDTVVIINADGREPASLGLSLYDLSEVARQQGCVDAINLDGGGSASFLTKRPEDDRLVYRNVPGDGFERKVTGSLLIVQNGSGSNNSGDENVSSVTMEEDGTSLTEEDGAYSYSIAGNPASGFQTVNGKSYLFDENGNGVTETIEIGETTYNFEGGMLTDCSDKDAGTVIIGYCGGAESGENLLYAYHKGNNNLNIGLNPFYSEPDGSMVNWTSATIGTMPWYSLRSDVKSVHIGKGVTNIGDRFLYVYKGNVFDGTPTPECELDSLSLPESLESIGELAFYNKPKLRAIKFPSNIKVIGKKAFAQSDPGSGYICFTGEAIPEIGKLAIHAPNYNMLLVPNTEEWKEFLDQEGASIGIKGQDNIFFNGTIPLLGKMIVFK